MADTENQLSIVSYQDAQAHLLRIREEVEKIVSYMYNYETDEDTKPSEVADEIILVHKRIDDDMGTLYSIVTDMCT
jgi:hypothetical protein